ncbi:MAG: hypothetical protein ACREAA_05545 [Candidatus Polarisedimenticolia bacterium]
MKYVGGPLLEHYLTKRREATAREHRAGAHQQETRFTELHRRQAEAALEIFGLLTEMRTLMSIVLTKIRLGGPDSVDENDPDGKVLLASGRAFRAYLNRNAILFDPGLREEIEAFATVISEPFLEIFLRGNELAAKIKSSEEQSDELLKKIDRRFSQILGAVEAREPKS